MAGQELSNKVTFDQTPEAVRKMSCGHLEKDTPVREDGTYTGPELDTQLMCVGGARKPAWLEQSG